MEIIPVIDILNGVVVHGVRGEREKYEPIKSVLCNSSDPLEVANVFKELGFKSLYVADLDSILKKVKIMRYLEKFLKLQVWN